MQTSKNNTKLCGYTLTELLISIACISVIMTAMIGSVAFAGSMAKELGKTAEETRLTKAAYDYIISLDLTSAPKDGEFEANGKSLVRNGKNILPADGLLGIEFEEREKIIFCELIYSDKSYEFAAGVLN